MFSTILLVPLNCVSPLLPTFFCTCQLITAKLLPNKTLQHLWLILGFLLYTLHVHTSCLTLLDSINNEQGPPVHLGLEQKKRTTNRMHNHRQE